MSETATPSRSVNLGIGEVATEKGASVISTVLGSCVSVCMYDERVRVGGMNHFMLPEANGRSSISEGRFGDRAIRLLLERMIGAGASRSRIVAKVIGGGQVLAQLSGPISVAQRNVEVAERELKDLNIRVVARDTGGKHGRKVFFHTDSGKVLVKAVGNQRFEDK